MMQDATGKLVVFLIGLSTFFFGIIVSGTGMLIRGDALGREAAMEVENRMIDRMDSEIRYVRDLLEDHSISLRRIEAKIDQKK